MKNNLARLLALSSVVAGGSLLAAVPASAVQISLADGDFFNVGTAGARFTADPALEAVGGASGTITQVEFFDVGLGDFVAPIGFATADLQLNNLGAPFSPFSNPGIVEVRSLNLLDTTVFNTVPIGSIDTDFPVETTFNVIDPDFDPFITIDIADAETPDLAVRLKTFTTTQSSSIFDTSAQVGVGFEGDVEYVTLGAGGEEITIGTGSFSTTLPTNGTNEVLGTAVLSFTVDQDVPESSTVGALIGLGLLGSVCALKKKSKVA